jgi:hypothetical protein
MITILLIIAIISVVYCCGYEGDAINEITNKWRTK